MCVCVFEGRVHLVLYLYSIIGGMEARFSGGELAEHLDGIPAAAEVRVYPVPAYWAGGRGSWREKRRVLFTIWPVGVHVVDLLA